MESLAMYTQMAGLFQIKEGKAPEMAQITVADDEV
jgi:hypothetical protein